MKKTKKNKKVRQIKRAHVERRKHTRSDENNSKPADYSTYGVSVRAATFWISGFCAAVTLVGNYDHFLVTTSWIKYLVSNWSHLLDQFWTIVWRAIGIDPPVWLRIISSHILFLSVYLSGAGISRREKRHYDPDADYLDIGLPQSTRRWKLRSTLVSDFYIDSGLKYITIGLSINPAIGAFSLTSMTFSAMSAGIIAFILISPHIKLFYRKKLAARMIYILFGAMIIYGLSLVPFMQFDPTQLPPDPSLSQVDAPS